MRILFGPDHDGLHISPDTPGAYEWWYFDALSDDGRFALVAIFFLGTPMSPYYKQVVDGKNPLPQDWCGVFFTLHEKVNGKWKERAYAYNLYRDGTFADGPLNVQIGNSRLTFITARQGCPAWHVTVEERGLWRHTLRADLHFILDTTLLNLPTQGDDGAHGWVCAAPVCRLVGTVTLPSGEVALHSTAYHDHNFGQLPWAVDAWYWGRARLGSWSSRATGHALYYAHQQESKSDALFLLLDADGRPVYCTDKATFSARDQDLRRNAYGFHSHSEFEIYAESHRLQVRRGINGVLNDGPFYERRSVHLHRFEEGTSQEHEDLLFQGEGIGEVFRPARLCGPIASRAMWTRIRRRS